jgi:hypothetical protein
MKYTRQSQWNTSECRVGVPRADANVRHQVILMAQVTGIIYITWQSPMTKQVCVQLFRLRKLDKLMCYEL